MDITYWSNCGKDICALYKTILFVYVKQSLIFEIEFARKMSKQRFDWLDGGGFFSSRNFLPQNCVNGFVSFFYRKIVQT